MNKNKDNRNKSIIQRIENKIKLLNEPERSEIKNIINHRFDFYKTIGLSFPHQSLTGRNDENSEDTGIPNTNDKT